MVKRIRQIWTRNARVMTVIIRKKILKFVVAMMIVFVVSGIVSYFYFNSGFMNYHTVEGDEVKFGDWLLLSIALTISPITMTCENIYWSINFGRGVEFSSLLINAMFLFPPVFAFHRFFMNGSNISLAIGMSFLLAGGFFMLAIRV